MTGVLLSGILPKEEGLNPVDALLLAVIGIAIVFIILILLMLIIQAMGKVMDSIDKKKKTKDEVVSSDVVEEKKELAIGSCGDLKLINVEEKDAAMIMAIVADELQTPLNELRFKSIKRMDTEEQK